MSRLGPDNPHPGTLGLGCPFLLPDADRVAFRLEWAHAFLPLFDAHAYQVLTQQPELVEWRPGESDESVPWTQPGGAYVQLHTMKDSLTTRVEAGTLSNITRHLTELRPGEERSVSIMSVRSDGTFILPSGGSVDFSSEMAHGQLVDCMGVGGRLVEPFFSHLDRVKDLVGRHPLQEAAFGGDQSIWPQIFERMWRRVHQPDTRHEPFDRRDAVYGYDWITIVPPHLVDRIPRRRIETGRERLYQCEVLPSGNLWIRATPRLVDYDERTAEEVFDVLVDVLPDGAPLVYPPQFARQYAPLLDRDPRDWRT